MKFNFFNGVLFSLILVVSNIANAGLITYNGDITDGSLHTSGGLERRDYADTSLWNVGNMWTLNVNAGDVVTIIARRLSDFDTFMSVWEGTESDTNAFADVISDSANMLYLGYADDELPAYIPQVNGCCGDPRFHYTATRSATWTVGVFSLDGEYNVEHFYNIQAAGATGPVPSVPEPSSLAIFALGMIGLASRRFKKQS